MVLMRESLPKFVSNIRTKGTVEENQAVVQGSVAVIGTYTVTGDTEKTLNLHIEGSTFPNWDGQDQKRPMTVIGDELKVTQPHAVNWWRRNELPGLETSQVAARASGGVGEQVVLDPTGARFPSHSR